MSCNVPVTLIDRFGVTYEPKAKDARHIHDFVFPAHAVAAWPSQGLLEFNFEAAEALHHLDCQINTNTLDVSFDDNLPPLSPNDF